MRKTVPISISVAHSDAIFSRPVTIASVPSDTNAFEHSADTSVTSTPKHGRRVEPASRAQSTWDIVSRLARHVDLLSAHNPDLAEPSAVS
jgi:hypothetical protein